jgi:2-polyprenyl-6-methoxyphenol hydroxylase-like FAD-dependent oxidoreductase
MAGLLCARVLAEFFDRVVIVERDALPPEPTPRKGASQGHQVHVLLAGGFNVIRTLFPGFEEEAVAHGAAHACVTTSVRRFHVNGWMPSFDSDLWTLHCSRSLLEWLTARRVLAWPNIEILSGRRVVGLSAAGDGSRVTGFETTTTDRSEADIVPADLVIDTSGRSSGAPACWRGSDSPSRTRPS